MTTAAQMITFNIIQEVSLVSMGLFGDVSIDPEYIELLEKYRALLAVGSTRASTAI